MVLHCVVLEPNWNHTSVSKPVNKPEYGTGTKVDDTRHDPVESCQVPTQNSYKHKMSSKNEGPVCEHDAGARCPVLVILLYVRGCKVLLQYVPIANTNDMFRTVHNHKPYVISSFGGTVGGCRESNFSRDCRFPVKLATSKSIAVGSHKVTTTMVKNVEYARAGCEACQMSREGHTSSIAPLES